MADLIGLGVVSVVATCSPTVALVPFRGGRIDATEGGAFGVPAPETSLTDTMSRFATAGFNNTEAIVGYVRLMQAISLIGCYRP